MTSNHSTGLWHKPAMAFVLWMLSHPGEGVAVTAEMVQAQWAVSRSTAYRMLNSFREAKGWSTKHGYIGWQK